MYNCFNFLSLKFCFHRTAIRLSSPQKRKCPFNLRIVFGCCSFELNPHILVLTWRRFWRNILEKRIQYIWQGRLQKFGVLESKSKKKKNPRKWTNHCIYNLKIKYQRLSDYNLYLSTEHLMLFIDFSLLIVLNCKWESRLGEERIGWWALDCYILVICDEEMYELANNWAYEISMDSIFFLNIWIVSSEDCRKLWKHNYPEHTRTQWMSLKWISFNVWMDILPSVIYGDNAIIQWVNEIITTFAESK